MGYQGDTGNQYFATILNSHFESNSAVYIVTSYVTDKLWRTKPFAQHIHLQQSGAQVFHLCAKNETTFCTGTPQVARISRARDTAHSIFLQNTGSFPRLLSIICVAIHVSHVCTGFIIFKNIIMFCSQCNFYSQFHL